MAKKTGKVGTSKVLRKTKPTVTREKGTVKYGRRKKQMGKDPVNMYAGGSALKARKKKK